MPKIYLFCYRNSRDGDMVGYALAEDGEVLTGHISSNVEFSKSDLGLTSDRKHEIYQQHYPNGFELEWVDDPVSHPGVNVALEKQSANKSDDANIETN